MRNKETVSKVLEILEPVLTENKLELWDVELVKEGQNLYLRVFIDKEGGVGIDDCEMVSRFLGGKLDELDPVSDPYMLEVSSPGINRELKRDSDFVRYIGEVVDIKLYKAQNKTKKFQGKIKSFENQVLVITHESGQDYSFERKDIAICRIAVLF